MARVLQVLVEAPRPCSYLEDREASLEHRVIVDGSAAELEEMLERGWRRFGPDHFRPKCGSCSSCVPTRVPVDGYAPSKSERRALRANAEFRIEIARPKVDAARVDLHARWHRFRESRRGWSPTDIDPRHYAISFAFPHPSVIEISAWDDSTARPRLASVAITDETPSAWSAVYFFYDPDDAHRSPGIANIARQIGLARARDKRHLYLGYLVETSASMAYKARFSPAERLDGWPDDDEAPSWRRAR
jgi:arginine-tRNA-protein transferase